MAKETYRGLVVIPGEATDTISDGTNIGGDFTANFKAIADHVNGCSKFRSRCFRFDVVGAGGNCAGTILADYAKRETEDNFEYKSYLVWYDFLSGEYWQTGVLLIRGAYCLGISVVSNTVIGGNITVDSDLTLEFSCTASPEFEQIRCNVGGLVYRNVIVRFHGIGVFDTGQIGQ